MADPFNYPHPLLNKVAGIQIWEKFSDQPHHSVPATLLRLWEGSIGLVHAKVYDEQRDKERIFVLRRSQNHYENYQFEFHDNTARRPFSFPPIPVWPWEEKFVDLEPGNYLSATAANPIYQHMPTLYFVPFEERLKWWQPDSYTYKKHKTKE